MIQEGSLFKIVFFRWNDTTLKVLLSIVGPLVWWNPLEFSLPEHVPWIYFERFPYVFICGDNETKIFRGGRGCSDLNFYQKDTDRLES